MKIKNRDYTITQVLLLFIYYGFLSHLPASSAIFGGRFFREIRYQCCRHIFKQCGTNVNIERKATFNSGIDLCIGDNSGIGINCSVPANIIIGENVMMGPDCQILASNHAFQDTNIPMIKQGHSIGMQTIIEDDVWIGRNVIFTPGRTIKKGSIVAAGCVLCKDFPEYSIIGGNPARLIRNRRNG